MLTSLAQDMARRCRLHQLFQWEFNNTMFAADGPTGVLHPQTTVL